jgi:hypothetical protein
MVFLGCSHDVPILLRERVSVGSWRQGFQGSNKSSPWAVLTFRVKIKSIPEQKARRFQSLARL